MADFIVSADLGQSGDFTAVAVLKRSLQLHPGGIPVRNHKGTMTFKHTVTSLLRFQLGTSYLAVVEAIATMIGRPELQPTPRLVIDATGVGRAVVDMFLDKLRGAL